LSHLFFDPVWKFSWYHYYQKIKAILEDQVFVVTNSWQLSFYFPSGFRLKISTWDPKVQFKKIKMTLTKICMKFWLLMKQTRIGIFLSQKPEIERNKFSHFKIFREKSRESSFLLHRSTKLKHTDSIFVPSFFCCELWEKEFHGSTSISMIHFLQNCNQYDYFVEYFPTQKRISNLFFAYKWLLPDSTLDIAIYHQFLINFI
jgi:hypothetical protein